MSAYDKPQQADLLDFNTTGALDDPSGYAYAQPPYAPQLLFANTLTGHGQDNDHLHFVAGSDYPAQHPFVEHRQAITDLRTRQAPEITSYNPQEGSQGSTVYVYVRTFHDLLAAPALSFSLLFASRRVNCGVELINPGEPIRQYAFSAEVPSFTSTGCPTFSVPLRLLVDSCNNSAPQVVEVGPFSYASQVAQPSNSRKRKASSSSDEPLQIPAKRQAHQQLRLHDQSADSFGYNHSVASPYSPFLPTPTTAGPLFPARQQQVASPRPVGQHHHSTSITSAVSIKAPSPHTPSWSPSFATVNKASRSPIKPTVTPAPQVPATSPAGKAAVPTLIRTSTIQQSSGSFNPAGSSHVSQSFNPYAMYPLKASLKLNGDLDIMAENWSLEEFDAKRRLVQFTRRQTGSTIHADFKGIAPEDRQPNSITISCIYWEEKKECYVTSVDTIFLLESLVAVRFTVEEKNRIRRNLEGFRPLTVSKSKVDSEEFFKTIMGFPNPKPRNIEKDVKVFPWKILALALKKIISKYSASYSSTAGALLTPVNASYGSNEVSVDHATSPHIVSMATSVPSYPAAAVPSYSPRVLQQNMPSAVPGRGPTDLHLNVPTDASAYTMSSNYTYQPQSQVSHPETQIQHPMSAPIPRVPTSWDFSAYVNTSPASANPNLMSTYSYGRNNAPVDVQSFLPPVSYSMPHPSSGI